MTYLPFNYIKLDNGTDVAIIPTNPGSVSNGTTGLYVAEDGASGIIEIGNSSAEVRSRSFAHGSVLNSRVFFSGKVFNFKFLVSDNHKSNLQLLERFAVSDVVNISSDWNTSKVYPSQFQKDGFTLDFDSESHIYTVSMIFATTEAF